MALAGTAARDEAERIRAAAPWRHPSRLSAVVWLYLGAGGERVWSSGAPVEPAAGAAEDWPYLAEQAAEGAPPPVRGAAERAAEAVVAGLLPSPRLTVGALHSRDFAPPSDMPALRLPYGVEVAHLAGALVACHVMLACAPLTLEPASARRAQNRRRFARGLHLAVSAMEARGLAAAVRDSAALLLDGSVVRGPKVAGFVDPEMSAE